MPMYQGHNSYSNFNYNAYTYCNKGYMPHFHKNFEVICVLRGEMDLSVNDSVTHLNEGQYAMILSHQIHSFFADANTMVWVAVFSEDFVPEFASYIREKQGSTQRFVPDEEVSDMVLHQLILGNASDLMRRACLYALCDQFRAHVPMEPRKTKNDQLICRVLDYVEEHYREDISLRGVAEVFGYEYHYLSRLLNRHYNIRFKNVLNEYRTEAAASALESGEKSITDIAFSCGFQSIRSFNDVFFAMKGCTPGEYRSGIRCTPTVIGYKYSEIVKKL